MRKTYSVLQKRKATWFVALVFVLTKGSLSYGQSNSQTYQEPQLNTLNKTPFTASCASGFDVGNIEGKQTPQNLVELSKEECDALYTKGSGYEHSQYQMAYDTLRKYVEHCANVIIDGHNGASGFLGLDGANNLRSDNPDRFEEYREWLKLVLYLNPDSGYYCTDVHSIMGTMEYTASAGGVDTKARIAILKFVHDSGKCKLYFFDYEKQLKDFKDYLYANYLDSVKDQVATPFDSTLPSIDDLGLGILRGPQQSVEGTPTVSNVPRVNSFTALRNPFDDEVTFNVSLSSSVLLRLDVYDELGRSLYGDGLGYKLKGDYQFIVPSKQWSSGIYYARLSTPTGEVKTVKLIKK